MSQKINTQLQMQTMTTQLHPKINLSIRSSSSSYCLSGYVFLLFTWHIFTLFCLIHCNLERWKIQKLLQYFSIYLCIRSMMSTNHYTFLFHQWRYIFRITMFSDLFLILSYDKNWCWHWNYTIDHHEKKKNIAKIGRITKALKPPNMPFPLCTPSSTEDFEKKG